MGSKRGAIENHRGAWCHVAALEPRFPTANLLFKTAAAREALNREW
jgi:hypothetical protein